MRIGPQHVYSDMDELIALHAPRPRRRTPATLAAAAVLLLAALPTIIVSVHDDALHQVPTSAGYVGYRWKVVAIDDSQGHLDVPAALHPSLDFRPDNTVGGDDTVNALDGTRRATRDGYRVLHIGTTLSGYVGGDPVRTRIIAAVDAMFYNAGVGVHRVDSDTLTLAAQGITVTTERGAPLGPQQPPSPT